MKKFFFFAAASFLSLGALFAENTNLSTYDNCIYAGSVDQMTVLQRGATGKIELYAKVNEDLKDFSAKIQLPAGIRITGVTTPDEANFQVDKNLDAQIQEIMVTHKGSTLMTKGDAVHVATLEVSVPVDAKLGTFDLTFTEQIMQLAATAVEIEDPINCSLSIRRTAVIGAQDSDYALEVIPFSLEKSATTASAPVNMVNGDEVAYLSFDVEYPEGITPAKSGRAFDKPTINDSRLTNDGEITALSAKAPTLVSGSTYHYELTNDEIDTYAANGSGVAMTLPLACSNLQDGVYTIKVKNINIQSTTDYTTFTDHNGEYYFSVFVGNPSTDKNPIAYGHYTAEAIQEIAKINSAETIDLSVAVIDGEEDAVAKSVPGVLVYTPTKTSLSRNAGIGTICVPYELTSDDKVKYYTLSAATDNLLTFTEQSTIAANTPALYSAEGEGFTAATDGYKTFETPGTGEEVSNLTFTGTYETKTIQNGYYIAGGKFWDAHQTQGVTIPAFRAYFEGSAAGIKSFNIALDETTGLRTITAELTNDPNEAIYDLSGRKLNRAAKGVNIVNGKKYLVK